MGNTTEHDNKELIRFWDQALALSKEEKEK